MNDDYFTKKHVFLSLIPPVLPGAFHGDPLDHQHQLRPGDHALITTQYRRGEGALLQALVVEHKPARLPVQEFEQGAAAVQEHEDLSAGRIAAEFTSDQARESVKTLAHITRPAVQVVAVGGTQAEHYPSRISWLISDRGAWFRLIRTPLG